MTRAITTPIQGPMARFLGGAFILFVFSAGRAGAETLTDLVTETLAANPDVLEAEATLAAREQEYQRATAGYRPSVDLNAGIGYEYTNSPATRSREDDSEELTRKELGLNLRQMLFDGWGTSNEVARQAARRTSAAASLRAVSESVAIDATEAYLNVARFDALRTIAAESLEIHQRIERQVKSRSDSGVGRRADYDQVVARVALAEANLVAAEVNLVDAQTGFQRVVGRMPKAGYQLPEPDQVSLPGNLVAAIEQARATNSTIAVADADLVAARSQHEAAKQFNYPRLDLEVGGNLNDDIDGVSGYDNDFAAMLRMRYNLYRGGADSARIRETAFNINEAKEVRHRSLRQLEEAIRLAWAATEATAAQLPLLRRQVDAAASTRDAYIQQFRLGQRTLLDVLNSENDVQQARQSVVNAQADHVLAKYRILEATGDLLPHFGYTRAAVN